MEKCLDLRGLACPIPVLKANKAIRELDRDDVVICMVTDPAAPDDFKDFCESTGHALIGCTKVEDAWVIKVAKSV